MILRPTALLLLLLNAATLCAQNQTPPSSTTDSVSSFKIDVRLVPVHVVVRDGKGQAIGHLTKDDFQLFDNGHPQDITQFSAEEPQPESAQQGTATTTAPANPPAARANRFVLYLFDDLHLNNEDIIRSRDAAVRQLAGILPTDRVAITSVSGKVGQNFTADQTKIHDALFHLSAMGRSRTNDCPSFMSYYIADLVANKRDPMTIDDITKDELACEFGNDKKFIKAAQQSAMAVASTEAGIGRIETLAVLQSLKKMVAGITPAPGRRTIVLVSPGFYNPEDQDQTQIVDSALRANVIISAVDARGLVAPDNIGRGPVTPELLQLRFQYLSQSDMENMSVLSQVTDGTGGNFFHNNNDLEAGFRKVASAPEYSYVLAFSPHDLKPDGHFHKLKVKLKNDHGLTVQARNGYYAPQENPKKSK